MAHATKAVSGDLGGKPRATSRRLRWYGCLGGSQANSWRLEIRVLARGDFDLMVLHLAGPQAASWKQGRT